MRVSFLLTYAALLSCASSLTLAASDLFFTTYPSYSKILHKLESFAIDHRDLVRYEKSIGQTSQYRDIALVHVVSEKAPEDRPIVWITGGTHASDWISISTAMVFVQELVDRYGTDDAITKLLNTVEFVVLPCLNPDGYEYSRNNMLARNWRKNRRKSNQGYIFPVYGVDLNRNWDHRWGVDSEPSSDTYGGEKPGSEAEVMAVFQYMGRLDKISGFIDLFAANPALGPVIQRPWGVAFEPSTRGDIIKAVSDGMAAAMYNVAQNTRYKGVQSAGLENGGPIPGSALDWAFEEGITALTIQIANGTQSSKVPESRIVPVGKEVTAGLVYFAEFIRDKVVPPVIPMNRLLANKPKSKIFFLISK